MMMTTVELERTASGAFAKFGLDDPRISVNQADLTVVLLFVAIGALLTATFFAAGSLADLGQILAAAG
jgi:hypothetical protein